jgi:hypothetical protein
MNTLFVTTKRALRNVNPRFVFNKYVAGFFIFLLVINIIAHLLIIAIDNSEKNAEQALEIHQSCYKENDGYDCSCLLELAINNPENELILNAAKACR